MTVGTYENRLPLGARIVPRFDHEATAPTPTIHEKRHDWQGLVRLAWEVGKRKSLTGELPTGVSSHQFWAKVKRASRARGGEVGIRVRGERWWVWSERVGEIDGQD